jgi:hypothetical protein
VPFNSRLSFSPTRTDGAAAGRIMIMRNAVLAFIAMALAPMCALAAAQPAPGPIVYGDNPRPAGPSRMTA